MPDNISPEENLGYQQMYLNIQKQIEQAQENIDDHHNNIVHSMEQILNSNIELYKIKKGMGQQDKLSKSQMEDVYKKVLPQVSKHFGIIEERIKKGMIDQLKGIPKLIESFNLNELLASPFRGAYWAKLVNDSIGRLGPEVGVLSFLAVQVWKTFLQWDATMTGFRQSFGLFRKEAESVNDTIFDIYEHTAHIGVTLKSVVSSYQELADIQGGIWNVSKNLAKNISLLNASLGLSQTISTGILRNFAVISDSSLESQMNALLFTKALTNAAGVDLGAVSADLGKMSDATLIMASKLVPTLIRSAVELRKMGTSLNEAAKSSRQLINFSGNVADEMEASVLLGHSINLQKARELAYNRDLIGSTQEILRIARQVNFQQLDPFQQEAFARATGKSADELYNILQTQKEINNALKYGDDKTREMAQNYEDLKRANAEVRAGKAKDIQLQLQEQSNQERIASIQDKWSRLLASAGKVFLPIIDKTLGFVADHFEIILGAATAVYAIFRVPKWLEAGAKLVERMSGAFGGIARIFPRIEGGLAGVFRVLGSKLGSILKFASRLVIPLMFAWNIFKEIKNILNDKTLMGTEGFLAFNMKLIPRAILGIFKALWTTLSDLFFGLPDKIIDGLGSASTAIEQALKKPFVAAWNWIKGIFVGNSPSDLALGILNGIASTGDMIFAALVKPFKMLLNWITRIPVLGSYISRLGGVESQVVGPSNTTFSPTGMSSPAAVAAGVQTGGAAGPLDVMSESTGKAILSAINTLIQKVDEKTSDVYLDGSLVSSTLARGLEFRGNYGVNR